MAILIIFFLSYFYCSIFVFFIKLLYFVFMIMLLTIIPTILFYLILKVKHLYRFLLSIAFYIFLFVMAVLFENTIMSFYYKIVDKIDYNSITDFTRILFGFSDILFIIFTTILLYIIYKTKNKKLIHYTIKFFVFIILYYLLSFICGSIYFRIINIYGYGSIILGVFYNAYRFFVICILLAVILFKEKN